MPTPPPSAQPPAPTPLARLQGQLIVSVQADDDSVLRDTAIIAALCRAVLTGGAGGLRVRGADDIRAARALTALPIIGLTKTRHAGVDAFITATTREVREVAGAGADIVAVDATRLTRPEPLVDLIRAAHDAGLQVMADISTEDEAEHALDLGADTVGTTMSGYTPHSPQQEAPDFALMRALHARGLPFVAEGRVKTVQDALQAQACGAFAVVVGSAITRPDHVTRWYADALGTAAGPDHALLPGLTAEPASYTP
ncbi:N-acetylmannosamine-6-phosphate 2-epimerase [Deinococcus aquiradiocola]|uniref:N-acylglucosamine-6-phosphate 2-epimerase n=1 Tax=Deinococcus aquiradiocola TaxID=393059 RepID=A0A917PGF4_9DEIO|nr:N-acetylmannosamine-6-phosphate 2-epimerase [Deinococcus aquiradiocola]GGJ77080.1 putative N-acetylmannosamine-6-phosphate 2-epimerase [Deinococcus aquiradiocola]